MSRRHYGRYAFLHARLGALKSRLLSPARWEQLLQARTWPEQQPLLAAAGYGPWLDGPAAEAPSRLRAAVQEVAAVLARALDAPAASFLRVWGFRGLLRNVKTILRGKALGRSEEAIAADLVEVGPLPLPLGLLLGGANVEAVLDQLEQVVELRRWVREARRLYQRDPTLFGLDAALDRVYYVLLREQTEALPRADRESVAELVALEIDHANLIWLLRYRLNFGLSAAETYYLLAPVTGRLGPDVLKGLARLDSLEAMARHPGLGPFRLLLAGCASVGQVESRLWQARAGLARHTLRKAAFSLGEVLAFLELKNMETRDLVALIEGTRLGAAREVIHEQLVGAGGPASARR